jgi:predicted glycosyltransferase
LKIWIDLATPKETLMLNSFIKEFRARGHEVILSTRKYVETNDLIEYLGLQNVYVAGTHAGTKEKKLHQSIKRLTKLYPWVIQNKPDALVNFSNVEACRIAFGLGIPIVNFTDMPESDKVMRLTLPLSNIVFTPFVVPKEAIWKYWDGPLYQYNCLDPIAWMPETPKPLEEIYPTPVKRPFIIYRSGEVKASYFNGFDDVSRPIAEELKKHYPEGTFFEVPRYTKHEMLDMQSLLAYADLFIGGGATMNIEAAWWGTWTMACRPIIASYDRWCGDG